MMNIFKSGKKGIGILAMATLLGVSSCNVTDLEPAAAVGEETAFQEPRRVELAVIGMYNAAQSGFYFGQVRGYVFGAAHIQQNEMRGEDMLNQALFYAITYEGTHTPFTANNVGYWQNLFATINQANIVIEGVQRAVQNGVITQEVGNGYLGEARAMRALSNHELVLHFARPYADNAGQNPGIPIRNFAINNPETIERARQQGRNSVAEVYAAILEDLDFAETNLPETRRINRFSRAAAVALKTRVKLHMQDWAGVLTEGNKLAPQETGPFSGMGVSLAPSPVTPFTAFNNNPESIFSIEHSEQDEPGPNGALAAMFGNPNAGGRGLVRISPIIFNNRFWREDDLRRTQLLTQDGRSYYTNKYRNIRTRDDWAPIIRYAEVLLNMAEAEARINPVSPRGLALLNAVRNRSVPESARYTLGNFLIPGTTLLQAIWEERRIELLAEGFRWKDIHRLSPDPASPLNGIPAKMAFGEATFARYNAAAGAQDLPRSIPAIPYADTRFVWPIPAEEVAQNPTLAGQQNPGY